MNEFCRQFMNTETGRKHRTSILPLLIVLTVFFVTAFSGVSNAERVKAAERSLTIHLFYSETCPHCTKEKVFLNDMQLKYPSLVVKNYEITENRDNLKLFVEVGKELGNITGGVPFLVIGNEYVLGYLSDETTGAEIEQKIISGLQSQPVDLVDQISQASKAPTVAPVKPKEKFEVNFPLLGKININSLTLPVLTVVLGLLDGFNPCAMWSLLFLISILLGTKNKAKMWLLGGIFIGTSALIYFLFMAAWLNFFLIIGYATAVRVGIGVIAAGLGGYYVWKFWKDNKNGCLVEGDEKRQKTFVKIRKIIEKGHLIWAIGGIMLLAIGVNVVELLCSAGFPAVYTKALTMTQMPGWKYYLYLAGYIFFYMLDDMVVFVVAMATLQIVGIKQSYAKYSHLLGGIIMLIIGILMLFAPGILMFN